MLEARTIGRQVGERWLWRELSFTLEAGDRLAVAGPSGSGKSLLLRCLAGLDPVAEGEILLDGRPRGGWPMPRYRAAVMLLAQDAVFREGRVEEDLRRPFGFRVHGDKSWDRSRAVALLEKLGRSGDLLERQASELSGGERQSLALVRAWMLEPRILLLDEPTAHLDADAARRVEEALDGWGRGSPGDGGRALVWTSHDADLLDRVTGSRLELKTPSSGGEGS